MYINISTISIICKLIAVGAILLGIHVHHSRDDKKYSEDHLRFLDILAVVLFLVGVLGGFIISG